MAEPEHKTLTGPEEPPALMMKALTAEQSSIYRAVAKAVYANVSEQDINAELLAAIANAIGIGVAAGFREWERW